MGIFCGSFLFFSTHDKHGGRRTINRSFAFEQWRTWFWGAPPFARDVNVNKHQGYVNSWCWTHGHSLVTRWLVRSRLVDSPLEAQPFSVSDGTSGKQWINPDDIRNLLGQKRTSKEFGHRTMLGDWVFCFPRNGGFTNVISFLLMARGFVPLRQRGKGGSPGGVRGLQWLYQKPSWTTGLQWQRLMGQEKLQLHKSNGFVKKEYSEFRASCGRWTWPG